MSDSKENNGFKTPKGYFDEFSTNLKAKIAFEEAVDSNTFNKENNFKTPKGYFENFNEKLHQKLDAEETEVIKLNPYKKYYYSAVAAAAVLLITLGIQVDKPIANTFDNLTHSDIETYFEIHDFEHTDYELAESIPVYNVQMTSLLESNLDEENMMKYFENNIDDIEDLNIEF